MHLSNLFCLFATFLSLGNSSSSGSSSSSSSSRSSSISSSSVSSSDPGGPNILVTFVSESASQWTALMASEVVQGVTDAGGTVRFSRTNETSCDDLEWADGIALGSPVTWGGLSSTAKLFLENVQNVCFDWPVTQLLNKVGVAFATGGQLDNGKDPAMAEILTAWRAMHMVVVGCDCGSNCTCNAWGASATDYDAANDQKQQLDDGEVTGARTLGARVVEIAALLVAGKEKQKR